MTANIENLKSSLRFHMIECLRAQRSANAASRNVISILSDDTARNCMVRTAIEYQEMARQKAAIAMKHLNCVLDIRYTLNKLHVEYKPFIGLGIGFKFMIEE